MPPGKKKRWTASEMGRKGGPARARALTAKRRSEIARKAGKASGRARRKK